MAGADAREDGARVVLRDVRDGSSRVVHARYLVAADGAHSPVRARLGIRMNGPDQLLEATTALFRAPLWRLAPDHRYGLYAVEHPAAAGVMLPAGRGDRWLYAVMSKPGERLAQDLTETAMARSDLGGRIAHIWVPSDEGRASTLDLVGPGLTLFTGPQDRPWRAVTARSDRAPRVSDRRVA